MQYQDLMNNEKKLFETIEKLFVNSSVSLVSFIRVLGVLINKYKKSSKKKKEMYCPKCKKVVEVRDTGVRYICLRCGEWCR